ncbi:MerR family transcriptional regulator [Motilibacter deserti]|uniref:MerR family transcriptional regulator n=1 Tax=Motilibacter deserti TaxID=2714956 RepID=A0ABX0H1N6_9ACTN|nr:MerR family transcriptional regulator [Motilibacter deserti]NHC15725.1 MerR family transcriptional regulator [Motilibacter deserti]
MTTATRPASLGIREVAEQTGLSMDTLRWYEREGLLPLVDRGSDGRRRYSPAAVRFILLVQALRRTGMPVADVRRFVQFGGGTTENHAPRMAMLEKQEAAIRQRIALLQHDLGLVQDKIRTYRDLLARGLDCEDETEGVEPA